MPPMNLAQPPLTPSVTTSNGSAATLSGRNSLSVRASRCHQARYDLVHLLSVAFSTGNPPLAEAIAGRLSWISQICAAKRDDREALLLLESLAQLPNNINDILSID